MSNKDIEKRIRYNIMARIVYIVIGFLLMIVVNLTCSYSKGIIVDMVLITVGVALMIASFVDFTQYTEKVKLIEDYYEKISRERYTYDIKDDN